MKLFSHINEKIIYTILMCCFAIQCPLNIYLLLSSDLPTTTTTLGTTTNSITTSEPITTITTKMPTTISLDTGEKT